MTNEEKYIQAFQESFDVLGDELTNLEYQAIDAWDSIGHMTLIAMLEEVFDIMFEMDDIIDLNSFEKGKEILTKYDVKL